MTIETTIETTEITSFGTAKAFTKAACSGTLMGVIDRAYGYPLAAEESASNPLAGGIVQQGYQCGMLWGAALAAGAQAYRLYGPGSRAEAAAMNASRKLVEAFGELNQETNCLELTDSDMQKKSGLLKYFLKGGPITCARRAMRFAPVAFEVINAALAEEPDQAPEGCASCAAMVARQMGASEMHAVMAAGLAGGIGLSGGGCGALGAAIWITGMNNPDEQVGLTAEGTQVGAMLDAFFQASDHRVECAEIVGRSFEDEGDHARHLRRGGCSQIIDALVAASANKGTSSDSENVLAA